MYNGIKVGFTGTRKGMSEKQYKKVKYLLYHKLGLISEFHHGCCRGSDAQAHEIAYENPITIDRIIVHPPKSSEYRAIVKIDDNKSVILVDEKEYLQRNHDIVNSCDILIATPSGYKEILRSGTWATIRYARKRNKPIIIIYPNGKQEIENYHSIK